MLPGALPQYAFKQHALVGHVLVDDPQSVFIDGEDEGIADLSQWPEGGERGQRGLFFLGVERRSAAVVWNRLREAAFEAPRYGRRDVGFDRDSTFEPEARGNWLGYRRLESESAVRRFIHRARRRCRSQVKRRLPPSCSGRQARAGSGVGVNLSGELRRGTRFHQSGSYGVAHKVVQQGGLSKADFCLRGMNVDIHFAGWQFQKQQHHRIYRWRNDVAISLGQTVLDQTVANQSSVDEDID